MKPHTWILLLLVAVAAAAGGWYAAQHHSGAPAPGHSPGAGATGSTDTGRHILYYQSPMHPWIRSPKPGKCTICGMDLTPVYEGEKGVEVAPGTVTLGTNSITVVRVGTTPVTRRPLQRTLRVAGVIEENDTRHRRLSAYVDGRIDQLFINYVGAEVREGEPLATFHSPMLLTSIREYLALLRQKPAPGEPPREEIGHLLAAAEQRLLQVGLSKPQIDALAARPDTDHMIQILSPMSGTVVAREIYAGQYVKEGDKLFEIADFSTMWFRFDAYERDLAWLRVGQKVRVTTPSLPGRVFEAPIAFIDPSLNESTRSAKVRVELQNPAVELNGVKRREILNRAYAEATVEVSLPEVLAVPRGAVLNANGEPRVYVDLGGGAYAQREVRLGRAGDEVWEVLAGVAEGERVVSSGNLLLDSQAQLNASVAPQAGPAPVSLAPATALKPGQESAVKAFLAAVEDVTRALAADSLEGFNKAAPQVASTVRPLEEAFAGDATWRAALDQLRQSARLDNAASLVDARKAFHPFSSASAEIAKLARRQPAFRGLHIFACPMTSRSYPGAPHDGVWIQRDAAVHNPFFGAEMLDCGTEVKP